MQNLLIVGGEQEDRLRYATNLILFTFCEADRKPCKQCNECIRLEHRLHPNVFFIEPMSHEDDEEHPESFREIKIEQIRKITEEIGKKSFENKPTFFVFTAMHLLTKAAANALLKSIEENPKDKYFLALAPSRMSVLPTICSRLPMHKVIPMATTQDENVLTIRSKIYQISNTPLAKRWRYLGDFSTTKNELLAELHLFLEGNHEEIQASSSWLLLQSKLGDALIEAIKNAKVNQNPKLIVENLLFHTWPYTNQ